MTDDQQIQPDPEEASPTQAFDNLRREVAFMRRAIERMSDEQRAAPDYSETLGQMNEAMTRAAKLLDWLRRQPAITVTPQEMAQDIQAAGEVARAADRRTIEEAARILRETQRDLSGVVQSARLAEAQERQVWRYSWIAVAVGLVVGVVMIIAVARLVPEHSATWLMGVERGQLEQRHVGAVDPREQVRQTGIDQQGSGKTASKLGKKHFARDPRSSVTRLGSKNTAVSSQPRNDRPLHSSFKRKGSSSLPYGVA